MAWRLLASLDLVDVHDNDCSGGDVDVSWTWCCCQSCALIFPSSSPSSPALSSPARPLWWSGCWSTQSRQSLICHTACCWSWGCCAPSWSAPGHWRSPGPSTTAQAPACGEPSSPWPSTRSSGSAASETNPWDRWDHQTEASRKCFSLRELGWGDGVGGLGWDND